MSSLAIISDPQTAALPQRGRIFVSLAQTTWNVTLALGAVIIGVTTLSFTLAHIGMNSLAFHLSAMAHHLSRYCREA
jgi:predicted MFS family arabinose efflux permease